MKDIVDKGDKEREMERKGRKDAPQSQSRMYAARVIPCDVYVRRSRRSVPSGNNVARYQWECISEGMRSLIALNC